jgi:hypothetical protein
MKNKEFDCVQMKIDIQEKLWLEGGETFKGLIELHDKMLKQNELYKFLIDRKKDKQLTTA